MYGVIYKTTCLINNKIYIGQRVIQNHNTLDSYYLGSGKKILRAINKYGRDNFERKIICVIRDKNQALLDKMEEFFIKKFDSTNIKIGYNILSGTSYRFGCGSPMKNPIIAARVTKKLSGRRGAKRSEQGKKNISIGTKKSWAFDFERRKKMSELMKRKMTPEHREHLSKLKKGIKFTEEHKNNIKLHHADFSGSKHPLFGVRYKWITDGLTNKRVSLETEIPEGWWNGKIQKR